MEICRNNIIINLLRVVGKGDLKTLEINHNKIYYMVSGKTKNDEDYSSTILYNNEKITKITDAAKKQNGVKIND